MTTPIRLRYTDSNNNQQIIGRLLRSDSEISQAVLQNPYETSYTNLTIEGDVSLFGNVPVDESNFNASEPEIFLDVLNQGGWNERERVYAESGGSVIDKGRYKNKSFYGFGKYTGQEKASVTTPVTTNLVDAFEALLPSGYTVDYPSGETPPNIERYTYTGNRGKGYQELIRFYNHVFWFTPNTSSGNYVVKLQPRGYGGQVDTFEKGVDPVYFVNWTKKDKLRRITEAEVIGVDSNNNVVTGSASTSPNNGRFIRRNVGFVETSTEADNIAENLIAGSDGGSPKTVEHGRVEAPIDTPPTNNLNSSVQIINDLFNVDDLFTVSVQRDYFHESKAQYTFEFEQELTARRREQDKYLDERNAELVEETSTDVGQQSFSTTTNNFDVSQTKTFHNPSVSGTTLRTGSRGAGSFFNFTDSYADLNLDGTWETLASSVTAGSADYLIAGYIFTVSVLLDWRSGIGQTGKLSIRLENITDSVFYPDSSGVSYDLDPGISTTNDLGILSPSLNPVLQVPRNITGDEIVAQIKAEGYMRKDSNSGTAIDATANYAWFEELDHEHSSDDLQSAQTLEDTDNDTVTGVGVSGSTDSKNVNTGSQIKEDRS